MPQPLPKVSSWPIKAALMCWLLLMSLCGALLAAQYFAQQSKIDQTYRHNLHNNQQKLDHYIQLFRQQSHQRFISLRAQIKSQNPSDQVSIANLERWWRNQHQGTLSAIEWIDQQGKIQWSKGLKNSKPQQQWFQENAKFDQYKATIVCQDNRCEELSILPLTHNNEYLGEIRARRTIDALLHEVALATELELALLDAKLHSGIGWQANFYTPRELTQQQLIPLGDPTLLKGLTRQPQSFAQLADSDSVWSLLSFPANYVQGLHLIARETPSPIAIDLGARLNLYIGLCLLASTIIAVIVWWLASHFSRRIFFYSELSPLLSSGKYQLVRERLEPLKDSRLSEDFTALNESFNTLSYQLESVDNAVDVRNQEMERLSLFDSLSGLPNRHLFQYEIQNDLRELRQHDREGIVAVLLMDLDKFKRINDSLGHQLGDQILEKMGNRLKGNIRSLGMVARLGGDEFAILLRSVNRVDQLGKICKKVLELVNKPMQLEDTTLVISCSIGVSVASVGDTYNDALKHAEIAMYKAKDSGGNSYRLFNAEMASEVELNLSLEGEIRRGFSEQEYTLYLQPKVNMQGTIKGFESLVRWDHPDRGILPPGEFIPAMENMGFISQLDNWVLEASCRQLKVLEPLYPDLSIAVNISSTHFTDETFLTFLQSCLTKYPIDPSKLELEITETLLMENMGSGRAVIDKIKLMGVRIAIDDFGTGYSSLSYLKKLPVDTLKIDREFIKDIPDSESDMQISSVIIFLAKQLNFCVVAEGVETSEQLVFLKASQCDLAQGFYFSKPIPAHKAILMLESERINLSNNA